MLTYMNISYLSKTLAICCKLPVLPEDTESHLKNKISIKP